MGIELHKEQLLSLTDATKSLPPIDGKRPHVSTLWRWCRRGLRGVRLEHVRIGHRVCTSTDALSRFVNRLAEAEPAPRPRDPEPEPKIRTPERRQRDIAKARAELASMGVG